LARAALPRAAVASRPAGAAPARPIALTLAAAALPALGAALLRRWSVLKNSRAASGGTRPPNRLARRRLGWRRNLALAAVAALGRAPVAWPLLPAIGTAAGGAGPLPARRARPVGTGLL
jgi:hypothetical protein